MNNKEPMKIKLSTAIILMILLVVIVIGGCYIIFKNNINQEVSNDNADLSNDTQNSEVTINNEDDSNVVNEDNSINTEENADIEELYNDEDKKSIEDTIDLYYTLLANKDISTTSLLNDILGLTVYTVQDPDYAPEGYVEHPDSSKYMWTGIKYSDFRGETWFLSDDVLEEKFPEFVEYNDYLYIDDKENGEEFDYEIISYEIQESSTQNECICDVTVKNTETGDNSRDRITLARGNGDFVISSVE